MKTLQDTIDYVFDYFGVDTSMTDLTSLAKQKDMAIGLIDHEITNGALLDDSEREKLKKLAVSIRALSV